MLYRFTSILRLTIQTLERYYTSLLAFIFAAIFAINFSPAPSMALDWSDLIRVVPSIVQYVQLSSLSDQDEVEFGKRMDREISSKVHISSDPQANSLIKAIGNELVPYSDRPNIPYTFQVVEDKDINAFSTMGGYVYLNMGLIAAADNCAQLAGIIGHEMGHIAGRHALEQIKQMAIEQGIATAAGVDSNQFVLLGVVVALQLPNSREAEFDADRRGVKNIARTGYAPQALPEFLKKLLSKSDQVPAFLHSHPAVPERIAALNETIQQNNLQGTRGLSNRNFQTMPMTNQEMKDCI